MNLAQSIHEMNFYVYNMHLQKKTKLKWQNNYSLSLETNQFEAPMTVFGCTLVFDLQCVLDIYLMRSYTSEILKYVLIKNEVQKGSKLKSV